MVQPRRSGWIAASERTSAEDAEGGDGTRPWLHVMAMLHLFTIPPLDGPTLPSPYMSLFVHARREREKLISVFNYLSWPWLSSVVVECFLRLRLLAVHWSCDEITSRSKSSFLSLMFSSADEQWPERSSASSRVAFSPCECPCVFSLCLPPSVRLCVCVY